jgi:hypothetical protein
MQLHSGFSCISEFPTQICSIKPVLIFSTLIFFPTPAKFPCPTLLFLLFIQTPGNRLFSPTKKTSGTRCPLHCPRAVVEADQVAMCKFCENSSQFNWTESSYFSEQVSVTGDSAAPKTGNCSANWDLSNLISGRSRFALGSRWRFFGKKR